MITVDLFIKTKNKKSLKKFLYFFKKNVNKNFNTVNLYFPKKKNKKVITLLKSPHVNKTAQEQFEIRFFTIQLKIVTTQVFKFLIFFKKIKNFTFADIQLKTKFSCTLKNQFCLKKNFFYLANYPINFFLKQKEIEENKTFKITKKSIVKLDILKNKNYSLSNKSLKLIDFLGH